MSIWEKAKYTSAVTLFITISYFLIQNLVPFSTLDLTLPIDQSLPFIPEFIWLYHTLVPVLMISCIFIIKRKIVFHTSCISFILTAMILNVFYVVIPSFYPRESFELDSVAAWLVELTRQIDGANNTFPSGHVALSWLLYFVMQQVDAVKRSFKVKSLFFLWAFGISMSTLFLKQHYFVDVLSGIVVAYASHRFAQKIYFLNKKPAWQAGSSQVESSQLAE